MYKVIVVGSESEDFIFESVMSCLPKKGDSLGFWINKGDVKEWVIVKVIGLVYEFDKQNQLDRVEITVFF